ncbi:mediator of DNA damage checkpoint protein 1 isoform X3 [Desmodus rotundus]|uniref:mediator of DNA damage checkpoint protein 1 isoform X3 n=1 Tax=Desmodus rotundus TaxID=9430 RepID=UPI00238171E3|nr:mediator of DNA damage checkpoint protein 1 isoform X3 [Desmodus rotundus]
MEDTQAIDWEAGEEEEPELPSDSLGRSSEPLGRLRVFSSVHGPEKDFPLYLGKNAVGRTPDCTVALPFPTISKQHAVIDILARNKAAIRDCGSLNGTQILRPPKFLSPGVSHRLRDQELVVFADLPCQYHRLDASLPFVSRGPLSVQETPRAQGGTQPWGNLLAEDSEEEVDPLSERCMVKEPRTTSPLLGTVVPESDEEGPSSAPDGPGPPCAFNFDSDTDEEESPQPAAGEARSAATRDATAETEQPKAVAAETQCEMSPCSGKGRNNDTSNGVVLVGTIPERSQPAREDSETDMEDEGRPPGRPAEVRLERAQPSGFTDSDTDMEEEIPATPAVVPVKKRQTFLGVSAESPGGPDPAHRQESLAGSDTDVETEAPLTAPLGRSQASVVIDSDTEDEEEVSAALTLARLKESHAAAWDRGAAVEGGQARPRSPSGRDRDTEAEEEKFPVEKREYVPKGHTDKAHSEESQPPFVASVRDVEGDKSSPGVHLERSRASVKVGISTQVEEELPPAPAVTLPEKPQVPVAWTNQTNVGAEGGPAKLPVMHLAEARPPPGTLGEPTQPQRKGAQPPRERGREPHADMTRDSGDSHDDSENLDLQATQCFVETEGQSMGGALDEPWEVLATQPFCLKESEASDAQLGAAHLEAQGSCPFSPRAASQDQHPESPLHTEPLGIQGREIQTAEKGMSIPREPAERVTLEGGPLGRETKKLPPEGSRENVIGEEEVTGVMKDREQKQVLARDTQRQESNKMGKSGFMERDMESLKVEIETPKELQEIVKQAPAKEAFEREAGTPAPRRKCEPGGTGGSVPRGALEGGAQGPETQGGSMGQKGQASSPTLQPEGWARGLVGLSPALVASGSQSGGRRRAPLSHRRWQRGHLSCKTPPAERVSRGDPETLDACVPATVPAASAPGQDPLICRNQEHPAPQSLFAPSPPFLKPPIPRTRQNGSQEVLENPLSSELDPLHAKPKVRPRGRSKMTSSPVSSIASESHPSASKDLPVTPEPTSRATRSRTHRSSVKTPKPVVPTAPELQPSTSKDLPVTPEPTSRVTRSRTHRSSVKTPKPVVPKAPELQPSQGGRRRTLRSTGSAVPVPTTPEFQSPGPTHQPISPEPIPQANCSRRPRATRKNGSLTTPIVCEPCSAPLEPNSPSSRHQRRGAVRVAKSLRTIPKPAFAELPEAPTHVSQIPKVEAGGRHEFTPKTQHKAFQSRKRPSSTVDSPPLQKRLQRGEVHQKTVFLKEEEDPTEKEEDVVIPGPGKREKHKAEEPKRVPGRSLRRTKPKHAPTAPKVLFTGVADARAEQAVLALGGSLASSAAEASHLVTDRVCRTVKFLCALGRGIPILSLDWLHQSHKVGSFLPPDEYVVTDSEQEKNFGFSLRDSLSRARERRLLEGYEIHVTPGVRPPPPQMAEIISCCGGTVLSSMPRSYKPQRVVITCSQDVPRCTTPLRAGLPILSPEFLLTGVLKQEAKPEAFVLCTLERPCT